MHLVKYKQHLSLLCLCKSRSDPITKSQTVAHVLVIMLQYDCQLFSTSSVKVSVGSDFTLITLSVIEEVSLQHIDPQPDL